MLQKQEIGGVHVANHRLEEPHTCPRKTSSRRMLRIRIPTLSPAIPLSMDLWNISTPVQMVFWDSFRPTISISSPGLMVPVQRHRSRNVS